MGGVLFLNRLDLWSLNAMEATRATEIATMIMGRAAANIASYLLSWVSRCYRDRSPAPPGFFSVSGALGWGRSPIRFSRRATASR